MPLTPREAMLLAIAEAEKGTGFVAPNPRVGCVILDAHFQLIGQGHHARWGEAHAEINALGSVNDPRTLEGAHVYVTLEPCAHVGRTGSCAEALARLPIASVTYGLRDPNPLVAGQGAEILKQAGKVVLLFDQLQVELTELSEIFLLNISHKRPFVALKVAISLDGKMALPDGTSQWITGESARAHVHYLRGAYDAVLIGVGTFLQDDPRLNSRDPRFASKPQRVVLLDPRGRSAEKLLTSNLLRVRTAQEVFVVTLPGVKMPGHVRQICVPGEHDLFDLKELLAQCQAEGMTSLFVEGGAATYAAFMQHGLVDRLYVYIAPKVLGEGLSWSAGWSAGTMDRALNLCEVRRQNFDDDTLVTGIPRR